MLLKFIKVPRNNISQCTLKLPLSLGNPTFLFFWIPDAICECQLLNFEFFKCVGLNIFVKCHLNESLQLIFCNS